MIREPVLVLAFMLAVVAFARWLEERYKPIKKISSAVVCTLLGITLANIGVIEHTGPVHQGVFTFAIPYAIVLVIMGTNLRELAQAGKPLLFAYVVACLGSLVGGAIAGATMAGWVGAETWKLSGAFAGAFAGGGMNFTAVGQGLEIDSSTFAAAALADNLSTVPYLLLQVWLAGVLASIFLRRTKLIGAPAWAKSATGDDVDEDAMRRRWTDTDINITDMAILGALPLAALWLARILSEQYPIIPEVLWLTTMALIVAQLPWVRKLRGAEVLSYFALHIFFIALGAASELGQVFEAGAPHLHLHDRDHRDSRRGGLRHRMALPRRPCDRVDREPGGDRRPGLGACDRHGDEVAPAGGTGGDRRDLRVRAGELPGVCLRVPRAGSSWMTVVGLGSVDALVTGAGRGLGRGIATALAGAGARVWLVAEVPEELEWTAGRIRESGGWVEVLVADLADEDERARLARRIRSESSTLRVIVNNAGVLERQPVESLDKDHWNRTMRVNLEAPVFLTRDLLPLLLAEGGSIVNISSRAGVQGFAGQTAYCASKFGIEAFTRCLAVELAGSPVSVNAVTPGIYLKPTSLTQRQAARTDAATRSRWNDPAQLGPAFVFLAGLRGEVTGCRFDAHVLTQALERWGPEGVVRRAGEVAEHGPESVL